MLLSSLSLYSSDSFHIGLTQVDPSNGRRDDFNRRDDFSLSNVPEKCGPVSRYYNRAATD